jgi:hypothetical protein
VLRWFPIVQDTQPLGLPVRPSGAAGARVTSVTSLDSACARSIAERVLAEQSPIRGGWARVGWPRGLGGGAARAEMRCLRLAILTFLF